MGNDENVQNAEEVVAESKIVSESKKVAQVDEKKKDDGSRKAINLSVEANEDSNNNAKKEEENLSDPRSRRLLQTAKRSDLIPSIYAEKRKEYEIKEPIPSNIDVVAPNAASDIIVEKEKIAKKQ